jgi:hypothetical protein
LEGELEIHRETSARQGSAEPGNGLPVRGHEEGARGGNTRNQLGLNVRWAGRGLRRAPGSAFAVVVLLVLGMGGVTTLFGPLYFLVLRPLPFPHSEQLVQSKFGPSLVDLSAVKDTVFLERRSLDRVFSSVMAYDAGPVTLSGDGPTVSIDVSHVSSEFFAVLGVQPRIGTADGPGVVVSDQFWRERLHSTRDLSKCSITLEGTRVPVIGVMPRDFAFPSGVQVWLPGRPLTVVGRLRPGISMEQAHAYLKTALSKRALDNGATDLESLHDAIMGNRRPLLWMLSAVSVLFLILTCAGATNLLLARGARRRQEMVLRTALGASRAQLIWQLLTETLMLSAAGGLCVLAFSALANHELRLLLPPGLESGASFSPASVALLVVLTLAVTLLCGMAPAFHTTGADLSGSLKAGHAGVGVSAAGRRMFSAHEWFTGGQLIVAMALLGSTGLLLHSLYARLNFPLGFQPKDVAVVRINLPDLTEFRDAGARYIQARTRRPRSQSEFAKELAEQQEALGPSQAAQAARNQFFYREATQRLAALPGVVSVAAMDEPPLLGRVTRGVLVDPNSGPVVSFKSILSEAFVSDVSSDAFRVLNIPLLAGRTFRDEDLPPADAWKNPTAPGVAIVSAMTAKRLWPNQDPIGQIVRPGGAVRRRVIGVVADIHESRGSLRDLPKVYTLFAASNPYTREYSFLVKLRAGTPFSPFAAAVKRGLLPLPADAAPPAVMSLEESQGDLPLFLALLACFSALGMVVAGLGVYATGTLMAAARTREMGIRLALGASAAQVVRMVLWRSLRVTLLALPVGAFGSWALGAYLKRWLFQVGAADPASYLISAAVLLVITLAAGLWPAIQAARCDPLAALRCDG